MTQGAESGPRACSCPARSTPTPSEGLLLLPGQPRRGIGAQTQENGLKLGLREEEEGHTCRGERGPAPNTLCNSEANDPNL